MAAVKNNPAAVGLVGMKGEMENVIANLELIPLRMNERKGDKIGGREADTALKVHAAGLLRDNGLQALLERPR